MKDKIKQSLAKSLNPVLNVAKDGFILYTNESGELLLHEWGIKFGEK
jgi:nitrogen-specific signal transduction histidine kinase